MEVDACLMCDICRVAYATDQELQEHNWSLMHHIKIEQTKKGAPHSCSLCMETCANIIEYGKHLNQDKHKIALSRQSQDGSDQMLNSLGLIPHPRQSKFEDFNNDRCRNMPEAFERHSRSFSQPTGPLDEEVHSTYQQQDGFKHPERRFYRKKGWKNDHGNVQGNWPSWDKLGGKEFADKQRKNLNEGRWNSMQDLGQDMYNQGQGQEGARRMNGQPFYDDNFGANWKDNRFFSHHEMNGDGQGWKKQQYSDAHQRRGSFDERFGYWNKSGQERRGRAKLRGRNHTRTSSYEPRRSISNDDRFSPESNSSSDSNGLKRRLEDSDFGAPEKSRRKNASSKRYDELPYTNEHSDSMHRNFHDESKNMHARSRSASNEKFTNSRSNSQTRKVTWSDQQAVSSTTDEDLGKKGVGKDVTAGHSKPSKIDLVAAVPDSSTEIKKKKKKGKGNGKKNMSNVTGATSVRTEHQSGEKDSTESVLEKAEKLCKKLRSDREKSKQQKLSKEKQKKLEKTEELNTQLAELSKENMKKITGRLETVEKLAFSDNDRTFNPYESLSESTLHRVTTVLNNGYQDNVSASAANTKAPVVKSTASLSNPAASGDPKIAARIAQTRADIDAIRAKIEGSVKAGMSRPGLKSPPLNMSPLSSGSRTPDNKSLLKMVNAPRTTRERLHVAQMLRNHAKSQSKFSLPRFNLKISDLVENEPEMEDLSEFSIETLAPSVQLEIANLIEADIKPDVAELQLLLDSASSENAELDSNILSNLGILQTPTKSALPHHELTNTNSTPVTGSGTRQRIFSSDSNTKFLTPEQDNSRVPKKSALQYHELTNTTSTTATGSGTRQRIFSSDSNTKFLTPEQDNTRVPGFERSKSPVSSRPREDKDFMDGKPSLSVEELVTEVNKVKDHLLGVRERDRTENISNTAGRNVSNVQDRPTSQFTSSLPMPTPDESELTILSSSLVDTKSRFDNVRVKAEVEDSGYDFNISMGASKHNHKPHTFNRDTQQASIHVKMEREFDLDDMDRDSNPRSPNLKTESRLSSSHTNRDSGQPVAASISPAPSTVHKSVHTKHLYPSSDELPVRDTDKPSSTELMIQNDSTVARVNAILNAVPNMNNVLTVGQPSSRQCPQDHHPDETGRPEGNTGPQKHFDEKDKQLDSSLNSNTSSVLDQVYSICVDEENVRTEINTVDAKIDKLKSLINEAQMQLNTFTDQRKELTSKESQFRTSRMRLLQENRSLQGSSGSQSESQQGNVPQLTEAQIQNLSNPMLVKFLMSQRQSDLSSMGGFSNVESGSQPEDSEHNQRRGSISSVASEHRAPVRSMADVPQRHQNMLFSQSIDILSGSTDTLGSVLSQRHTGNQGRDSGTPIPADRSEKREAAPSQENATSNSFSLLKHPMDNFVTLDALMKGDTEIGKLIHKSLESIQKGEVMQEEEVVIKTPESTSSNAKALALGVRGRRESALSTVSDDMCISGSDTEKLTGKVSMKYMGTLPEGVNYDSIVKQISSGGKNKPLMFTVLSSPEPMVTGKPSFDNKIDDSPLVSASGSTKKNPDITSFNTDFGLVCDKSPRSDTTSNLSLDLNDGSQSARSNFSLGEQIKRMCDGHEIGGERRLDLETPRSESSGEKTLEDESSTLINQKDTGIKDCFVKLDKIDTPSNLPNSIIESVSTDLNSPVKKRLKSKRERDQNSRRKQKETFIIQSDTNSEEDKGSQNSSLLKTSKCSSKSGDDLVLTGSEDARTPRLDSVPIQTAFTKKSLLDEVQLETETFSESGDDKSNKSKYLNADKRSSTALERLNLKNLKQKKNVIETSSPTIEFPGPPLSVTAIQLFKGDVFVCYNGSELRRFELKTGKILRELDCSPYLVNCLHVTSVEEREDILYTAGACKKLMLFNPTNFSLITTFSYSERVICLHENWGRLFVGLADGSVSVRSVKTDKELNTFSCTASLIHCLTSVSAGMTKMLCLGTGDKIIYILDAITGLLITMLEGHTRPPLCIQVMGDRVISGSTDHTILVHNVSSGELLKTVSTKVPLSQLWTDGSNVYAASQDQVIRMYDPNMKLSKLYMTDVIVTYGMIDNGLLFTGNRSGMVEAISLSSLSSQNISKEQSR